MQSPLLLKAHQAEWGRRLTTGGIPEGDHDATSHEVLSPKIKVDVVMPTGQLFPSRRIGLFYCLIDSLMELLRISHVGEQPSTGAESPIFQDAKGCFLHGFQVIWRQDELTICTPEPCRVGRADTQDLVRLIVPTLVPE